MAVRDGVVVSTSASLHSTPDLEATIDAGHGDTKRYHEVDTTFEAVTDAVGASRMVSIGDHPTLNPTVAELGAYAFRVDDEAAYPFLLERYPETVDQPGERMKDAIEDQHYTGMAAADTIDIRVDGQLATAGARMPLQPDEPRDLIHDPPRSPGAWPSTRRVRRPRSVTSSVRNSTPTACGTISFPSTRSIGSRTGRCGPVETPSDRATRRRST
ncbi:hypothetical protein [Haloarcula sp. CBA1127]|uniref:hypothetical protein n=1 Tax=Haloarcula sp. CBA1127 TaxID=1765055 RepID=UPI001E33A72D|nr:hypothetical protein [Haloarcula sp. CBA1127]